MPERQDASGEGHQARRGDFAEARRSQRPARGSRERGRVAEDRSAPVSHTDADEAEPVGPPPVGRGTSPTTKRR
jgi:hypothetical protein